MEDAMPIYEFRCTTCDERFERRRAMRDADGPATCSRGHDDVVRLLPAFATTGHATAAPEGCGAGSACCGGLCATS